LTDTNAAPTKGIPPQIQLWEGSSAYVEQGKHWSSALIWLCTILFGGTVLWAFTAKLDQTITVRGRLEPAGSVREIDSPSAGVVSKVYVKDGMQVAIGQPLFDVEAKGLASRRTALITSQALLDLQARSLKSLLSSGGEPSRFAPLPSVPNVRDPVLLAQLFTARQQSQQIRSQLEQLSARLSSRRETLRLQRRIAADLLPLYRSGGMARNQYLTQLNEVQVTRSEVTALEEERQRVIGQAAAQLNEINRQIINTKAELVGLRETISYRTVRSPIAGKIFDNQVVAQAVVNADQVVLKVVPENRLQAKVEISDADIGFVKVGLPVSVTVDSFPSGEFGYIRGTLIKLGSDALKPEPGSPQYRFPATISLKQQAVESGGKSLNLQSGMGVSANIKLRSRPVITIVTDMFTKQLDGVKRFR
jgi:hemolysin D